VGKEANASNDRSLDRVFSGKVAIIRNDHNPGTSGRVPRDKRNEERVSIRMRDRRASYPDCRAAGRARMVGVFVASRGQATPIHATETYQASPACRAFVRGEKLVGGKTW